MVRLQIRLGKSVDCIEVMSIDFVFFFFFNYTVSLLTCYSCLVRKWMRQAFGRNNVSDRFYWKSYPASCQLDFQWGKIIMMVDFPEVCGRLLFKFHLLT